MKPFLSMVDEPEFDPSNNDIHNPEMRASKKNCMIIEKSTLCNINSREVLENDRNREFVYAYGIMGIINICGVNFLLLITERT